MTDSKDITQNLQASLLGEEDEGHSPPGSDAVDGGEYEGRSERLRLWELHEAERFIMFTDAVVAISITLLILPLMEAASEEEGSVTTTADYFKSHWEKVIAFGVSFFFLATVWIRHEKMFQHVGHVTTMLLRLNFLWMGGVVFFPVATSLLVQSDNDLSSFVVYIGTALLIAFVSLFMCIMIRGDRDLWRNKDCPLGSLFVVDQVVRIILLFFALLLAFVVPKVRALCLLPLLPRGFIIYLLQKWRPDWTYH